MSEHDDLSIFNDSAAPDIPSGGVAFSTLYRASLGGFGAGSLTAYLTNARVKDLEEDLQVYETLAKDKEWPVSQIIQREVDAIRVDGIAKDYILGKGRGIKYFPPIIVAILPRDADGRIAMTFNLTKNTDKGIREAIWNLSAHKGNEKTRQVFIDAPDLSPADGLYMLEISRQLDYHLLCWDKRKYYAVVIDGQHRFDALVKSKGMNAEVGQFTQDVVFLDCTRLSAPSAPTPMSPVEIVRRVFVDINTNAQRVGAVRQILMDDKDLASLIVQSLVDSAERDGSSKPIDRYIPSMMVDWYGDSLKHSLPHITGVLALHQIVNDNILLGGVSSVNDLRNYNRLDKWVRRMNDFFRVDERIKKEERWRHVGSLSDAWKDYQIRLEIASADTTSDEENYETELFTYDYRVLEVALDTFNTNYASGMVRIFQNFEPYRRCTEIVARAGGTDRSTTLYNALVASRNKLKRTQTYQRALYDIRIELDKALLNDGFLIYTVLFQKALLGLYVQRLAAKIGAGISKEVIDKVTEEFLKDVNAVVAKLARGDNSLFGKNVEVDTYDAKDELSSHGSIATSLWEGIIYANGRIIYNTFGIRSLSALLNYFIVLVSNPEETRDTVLQDIPYVFMRTSRIIKAQYPMYPDELVEETTKKILQAKNRFILSRVGR